MTDLATKRNKSVSFEPRKYVPSIEKKEFGRDPVSLQNVPETFVNKLGLEKKPISEVFKYFKFLNIFYLIASFHRWL